MPIANFDFPGITFRQTYADNGAATVRTLGVGIIGRRYILHSMDDGTAIELPQPQGSEYESGTSFSGTLESVLSNGSTGLDTTQGSWHLYIRNGVWSYAGSGVSNGMAIYSYDSAGKTIWLTAAVSGKNAWTGLGGVYVEPGDIVLLSSTVSSTTTSGTANVVAVAKDTNGLATGITIDAVPSGVTVNASATIKFCKLADCRINGSSSIGSMTADNNDVDITVAATVTSALPSLGIATATMLSAERIYVEFREKVSATATRLGTLDSVSEIGDKLGPVSPDNPMAAAAYAAMMAGQRTVVYYVEVADDTLASYAKACEFLEGYPAVYSIVPCTSDSSFIRKLMAMVESVSNDKESGVRKALWYGIDTSAVTAEDAIPDLQANRCTQSERAQCVFADGVLMDGYEFGNYVAAAAAAGMRAYEPFQRPLSNLGYSFFTLANTHGFTKSQLKQIAANGIWVIADNEDGTPVNKRQVTTAVANSLNKDEESIIAIADTVALDMQQVGRNLVGCSNISPDLLAELEFAMRLRLDRYLINDTGSPYIGAPLLGWELTSIYQDTVNRDHVYAEFDIEPPRPFNKFHMAMRVL